jgi:hypothetical protein
MPQGLQRVCRVRARRKAVRLSGASALAGGGERRSSLRPGACDPRCPACLPACHGPNRTQRSFALIPLPAAARGPAPCSGAPAATRFMRLANATAHPVPAQSTQTRSALLGPAKPHTRTHIHTHAAALPGHACPRLLSDGFEPLPWCGPASVTRGCGAAARPAAAAAAPAAGRAAGFRAARPRRRRRRRGRREALGPRRSGWRAAP